MSHTWQPLAILWIGLAALRLASLALHLAIYHDFDGLWRDYARGGTWFQLARLLDILTLGAFLAAAVWAMWGMDAQTPVRFSRVFAAWLGFSLLQRLPVHRFPRMNQPGALGEAAVALAINVLPSVLGVLGATLVAAIYFRWRG